jgi:hypothetical protein
MFGRAEGAVNDIVFGTSSREDCYDYEADKEVQKKYSVRQAQKILPGESSVGCSGKCRFCQYSATRRTFRGEYSNPKRGYVVREDIWGNIRAESGNQTTALDGFGEDSRDRVRKPVDNSQIVEKLSWVLSRMHGIMRLKVFQIVGYPWETEASIRRDLKELKKVLGAVKPSPLGGRIMMMFTVTPFSPEPLTDMENDAGNIDIPWRDILLHDENRCVFDSNHLNAFILPQIPGPLLLYKRIAVNRGMDIDRLRAVAQAKTIDDAVKIGGNIHLEGAGLRVSDCLTVRHN